MQRAEVLKALSHGGPATSIAQLMESVPHVARRELEDLRARVARVCRRRRRESFLELVWLRPGAVWAGDFSHAPCLIDGQYGRLSLLRDLASQEQILAQPARTESEQETSLALEAAFAEHGAPLVVKLDHGPGFIARRTRELLERERVALLYSPVRMPQYNGSCEAGGGSIKMRARRLAASAGRAGAWTCDDLEAARLEANAAPAPGEKELSREALWQARPPISAAERTAFQSAYQAELERLRAGEEDPPAQGVWPEHLRLATMHRRAQVRALIQRGYLVIRRGRVCPLNRRR
jgi:transposase InsO family protein